MAVRILSTRSLPALILAALSPTVSAAPETFVSCPVSTGWPTALQAAQGRAEVYRAGLNDASLPESFLAAWAIEATGLARGRLPGPDPIGRAALRLLLDHAAGRCQAVQVEAQVRP